MKCLLLTPHAILVLALGFVAGSAVAQNYPSKPIRIITHSTGGGATVARIIGQKISEGLGQQVVIDSRPGGGSIIASELVAKSPPDGYTMYVISSTFTTVPALKKKLPFDPVKDFAPVSRVSVSPLVMVVHPSLPVRSVQELIRLAKSKPGWITFGSAGIGSPSHIAGELFNLLAKVKLLHVPYKGSAATIIGMMTGEVAMVITSPINAASSVMSRRLKLLAVTSATRSPAFPDVPTMAESGIPGYEYLLWNGLLLPGATPQPIVERVHAELAKAAGAKDVIELLARDGARPIIDSRQEFSAFLEREFAKSKRVVNQFLGIQPD